MGFLPETEVGNCEGIEQLPHCLYFNEEADMMERQIKLSATEDVKEFVHAASKCDFDIDVFYNRIIIDAKSILGILSMDLTKVLTVKCYGEDANFNKVISKFAVA